VPSRAPNFRPDFPELWVIRPGFVLFRLILRPARLGMLPRRRHFGIPAPAPGQNFEARQRIPGQMDSWKRYRLRRQVPRRFPPPMPVALNWRTPATPNGLPEGNTLLAEETSSETPPNVAERKKGTQRG